VMKLVKQLDMNHIPMLVVFNKKDKVDNINQPVSENSIFVSARDKQDQVVFKDKLVEMIKNTMEYYEMELDASDADQLYWKKTKIRGKEMEEKLQSLVKEVETTLRPYFDEIEHNALIAQERVLDAFHKVKISEADLVGTTGYGYDDMGRDHLEEVYTEVFRAE